MARLTQGASQVHVGKAKLQAGVFPYLLTSTSLAFRPFSNYPPSPLTPCPFLSFVQWVAYLHIALFPFVISFLFVLFFPVFPVFPFFVFFRFVVLLPLIPMSVLL